MQLHKLTAAQIFTWIFKFFEYHPQERVFHNESLSNLENVSQINLRTENIFRISGGTNFENFSTWCLHRFHVCTCLPKKTLDPSWWWNCSHKPLLERFLSAKTILGSHDNYCFISINKLLLKSLESPLNDMLDFESLQHVLTLVSIEDLKIC